MPHSKESFHHWKTDNLSVKQKILNRLFYKEEIKGEKLVTLIVLLIVMPALLILSTLIIIVEKYHLNSVFNILGGVIISIYFIAMYIVLRRNIYRPFMKFISMTICIVSCTMLLYGYSIASTWAHSIRTVVVACYIICIIVSSLYQNPVVPIYSSILASFMYSILIVIALFLNHVRVGKTETFYKPDYSFDIYFFYIIAFLLTGFILSSLNSRYRRILERSLRSEAHSRIIKQADKQKTNFFINLAHEIKTPLTIITNYLEEYIKTHGENPELHIIRQNIEKLKLDMINFLDYEKLERGQIFYNHNQVTNASRLVTLQTILFKELARKKQIEVAAEITEDIYLRIDPAALERIINNLLDNAIKYTQNNGRVSVTLHAETSSVKLTIADTGPGISSEEQQSIFKPFYQLSHRKRNLQGIGMGLNIVKKIVDETDGILTLTSSPSEGTSFTICFHRVLPVENQDIVDEYLNLPPVYQYEEVHLFDEKYIAGRANILLIDDNKALLYYLQKKLHTQYNVFCATNGREALEKITAIPRPNIIICDIMMDNMDGNEFYDHLAANNDYKSIPLIFLTALTSLTDKLAGLKKGAVDYINKPFHIEELLGKVDSIIRIQTALATGNIMKLSGLLYDHLNPNDHEDGPDTSEIGPGTFAAEKAKQLYRDYGISKRQIEIIALLKIGLERKEISDRLGISLNTTKTQIQRMFEKCHVSNKTELLNIFNH